MNYWLGLDFGTSGARAIVIDEQEKTCAELQYLFPSSAAKDWANYWREALFCLLAEIPQQLRQEISAIAINGTSATVLLCDEQGNPLVEPILYNDGRGVQVKEKLTAIAPPNHLVLSATSSLAKLLWWYQQPIFTRAAYFLHQADWLAFLLHGKLGISDYHNALKLGYDVGQLCYPIWLELLPIQPLLPQVFAPGTPVAEVTEAIALRFGLRRDCWVCTASIRPAVGPKIPLGESSASATFKFL